MDRRRFLAAAAGSGAAAMIPAKLAAAAPVPAGIKITGLETDVLRFPRGRAFSDAIHDFGAEGGGVVVRILTNANITGWAYSSFGMVPGGPRVVATIAQQSLKPVLLGQDPSFSKQLRAAMWKAVEYQGVQGVTQFALAAVDIALWDICGKAAGLPVWRMLGAYADRVPAYNMCGWYYENDSDLSQYKRSLAAAMEEGFRAVKIKVGRHSLEDDIVRVRTAREVCGKGARIMVDANQVFRRNEALRRGRVYQDLGCFWYEEPLPPHERDGYAELARELDIRIATGENEYTRYSFLDLLQREGADVVQPDNRRAGGVTEWMEIAAIADAFGVEVASHGGGPTNMHMLLAMPNAVYIETGSLRGDSSHTEQLRLVDGAIMAPQGPGMGSELKPGWIASHKA